MLADETEVDYAVMLGTGTVQGECIDSGQANGGRRGMGQKVKGGLWCPSCNAPRMGVKNRHRVRNTASGILFPFTGGLSAYGGKRERYVCNVCGTSLVHK